MKQFIIMGLLFSLVLALNSCKKEVLVIEAPLDINIEGDYQASLAQANWACNSPNHFTEESNVLMTIEYIDNTNDEQIRVTISRNGDTEVMEYELEKRGKPTTLGLINRSSTYESSAIGFNPDNNHIMLEYTYNTDDEGYSYTIQGQKI